MSATVDGASTSAGSVPPASTSVRHLMAYVPNKIVAIAVGSVFVVLGLLFFAYCFGALSFRRSVERQKSLWGLALPIACVCEGAGWFSRLLYEDDPSSIIKYIPQSLLIICSPAGLFAFNYVIYGRLIAHLEATYPQGLGKRLSIIKASLISWIFVLSDVFTLLIQMAGGGMMAMEGKEELGNNLFKIGIIAQAATYAVFVLLTVGAFFRLRFRLREANITSYAEAHLFYAMFFSSVFLVIRSAFRTVEGIQGHDGELQKKEIYVLVGDTIPLALSVTAYLWFWPADYFQKTNDDHLALPLLPTKYASSKSDLYSDPQQSLPHQYHVNRHSQMAHYRP